MTLEQAVSFGVFAAVAAGTPGPSNALLTATGANVGILRGLPALLGVALGMGVMLFVVGFGLGSLMLDHPLVMTAIRWVGAAVLCWFAWKIATADQSAGAADPRPIGFGQAAVFQWVNPKSWLVCASAAATFLDQGSGGALVQSASLALVFVLVCLPACLPWLAFGALLQRLLRSKRARRSFNYAMGALLAVSVVLFVR
ncbi:MAG: LysE family translocator [Chloroflexi bacterium]|nr:LysE family translocator [Chloroflexota bacterium]